AMTLRGFTLDGKIALVTGGGRGLGFEIAKALASAGASVLINGRTHETIEHAVTTIISEGGSAVPLPFDITDEIAIAVAFREIRQQYRRLDILVNNVGVRDRRGLFELELDAVRRLVEANLIAPFNLSREAARLMIENRWGRIINITSIAGPIANVG